MASDLPYPVLAVEGGGGDQGATPMGSGCSRAEPASGLGPTAEHPSRMQWRPIATAPKGDEDSILVCDARVVGGFHQVVWWSDGPKATGYNWYTSDGPNFHRDAFTHWMPLPPEPAQGIEAEGRNTEGGSSSPKEEGHD